MVEPYVKFSIHMSHEKDVKLYVLYCVHKKLNNYCMGYSLLCLWLAYLVVSNHSTILSVRHLSDIIFEKLPMCRKNLPKSVLYYNAFHNEKDGGGENRYNSRLGPKWAETHTIFFSFKAISLFGLRGKSPSHPEICWRCRTQTRDLWLRCLVRFHEPPHPL